MKKLLFITLWIAFAASCGSQTSGDGVSKNRPSENACAISRETAGAIAKGYMCLDYEIKDYEVEVKDAGENYEVHLKRLAGEGKGSGPILLLRKADGERVYTVHSK